MTGAHECLEPTWPERSRHAPPPVPVRRYKHANLSSESTARPPGASIRISQHGSDYSTALASLINPYQCLRTRTVAERAADPKYRLVHHREYLLDELDPLAHDTKQLAGGHQRRYARLRRRPGGVRASAKIAKGGSLCMHRGSGSNLRRRSIECDVARPCLPRHALTCAGSHRASVTPVDV